MGLPIQEVVREKLAEIVQEPEIKVLGHGKVLQINVQIVGDSAIDKALFGDESTKRAMKRILDEIPRPKLKWLVALAYQIASEGRNQAEAGNYLGVTDGAVYRGLQTARRLSGETGRE